MNKYKRIIKFVLPAIKPHNPLVMIAKQMKLPTNKEPSLDRGRQRREDLAGAKMGS